MGIGWRKISRPKAGDANPESAIAFGTAQQLKRSGSHTRRDCAPRSAEGDGVARRRYRNV
ncbi:MAG: hypothetical protein KA716_27900 [Gloeotrichia echinulata DEX184]|nr:hypothetical protein [Gloeotrichia echinulata DEX184]